MFTALAPASRPTPAASLDDPLSFDALVAIASGIASSPLWSEHAHHDPAERRPVRLLATPAYEVWVIGWTTGQGVEPHDHGSARGVLAVAEGTLTEVASTDGGLRRTELPAGSVHRLEERIVHEVVNAHTLPATSIHVYSPPLRSMTFYDPADGRPIRTDLVDQEVPALASDSVARALHPSVERRG
jgi:predicted metal-dependent enzyme (double-stranded beta helix superfamily)